VTVVASSAVASADIVCLTHVCIIIISSSSLLLIVSRLCENLSLGNFSMLFSISDLIVYTHIYTVHKII